MKTGKYKKEGWVGIGKFCQLGRGNSKLIMSVWYCTVLTVKEEVVLHIPDFARAFSMGILTLSRMSLHISICSDLSMQVDVNTW